MDELILRDEARKRFNPFLDEIFNIYKDNIHSIYITGSALTDDFNPKLSDINSLFVLKEMDLNFLKLLAPLGKKYGKKRVSAPLIMTPPYILNSLDVFPLEFVDIKVVHKTVFGEDLFQNIEISGSDLRRQCERELKIRLISLRQGYISSSGNRKILSEGFMKSFSGYIPLFRGIIILFGQEPPIGSQGVLKALQEKSGVNTNVFKTVLRAKKERVKFTIEQLNTIFEDYYQAIEKLGNIVDAIEK